MLRAKRTSRTEPQTEPVTAEELRAHLGLDSTEEDAYLESLISAARKMCEESYLWRCIYPQTCVDYFDGFDSGGMELRWGPDVVLDSVTYLDADGVSQTLSTDVYELGISHGVYYVRLKFDQTFPSTRDHEDCVTVTYTAGWGSTGSGSGSTDAVPAPVLHWIKMYAGWLYDRKNNPAPGEFEHLLSGLSAARVL